MSQIHYSFNLTLQDLVNSSSLIVIATKEEPFIQTKKLDIGLDEPYNLIQFCYTLDEVVYGDKNLINKKVEVLDAEWENQVHIHEAYIKEGMSISPAYLSYRTSCAIEKEDKIILFLSQSSKEELQYTNIGSYESLQKLEGIKELIQTKNESNLDESPW